MDRYALNEVNSRLSIRFIFFSIDEMNFFVDEAEVFYNCNQELSVLLYKAERFLFSACLNSCFYAANIKIQ